MLVEGAVLNQSVLFWLVSEALCDATAKDFQFTHKEQELMDRSCF